MKALIAGLAACLAAGAAVPVAAADLAYGYHRAPSRMTVLDDRDVQVYSVENRIDVRRTPWLRYEIRSEAICKLRWERTRTGPRPVEVCARW